MDLGGHVRASGGQLPHEHSDNGEIETLVVAVRQVVELGEHHVEADIEAVGIDVQWPDRSSSVLDD
jgi:hypothetical protein